MTDDQAVPLPPDATEAAHDAVRALHDNVDGGCICDDRQAHLASLLFVTDRALAAAAPALRAQGAATERERIRELALDQAPPGPDGRWLRNFADLLDTL